MFTLDTESGFDQVVFITSAYGLGETVVQGAVNPDEFYVYKRNLAAGRPAILRKSVGTKAHQDGLRRTIAQPADRSARSTSLPSERVQFSITDAEAEELARYAVIIEHHYGRPMDIEWGRDGVDGKLYILQARPETVKSRATRAEQLRRYRLKRRSDVLATGRAIGQKIGQGACASSSRPSRWSGPGRRRARHRHDRSRLGAGHEARRGDRHQPRRTHVPRGDHRARARHSGGRRLRRRDGDSARRQRGHRVVRRRRHRARLRGIARHRDRSTSRCDHDAAVADRKIMMNVGNPELAFEFQRLPNEGVGLARLEFIINRNVGIHPKALLEYDRLSCRARARRSRARIAGYASPDRVLRREDRRGRGDDRRGVLRRRR